MLALMLVCVPLLCSCRKETKRNNDPHKLNGEIYVGVLYGKQAKIAIKYSTMATVQIVETAEVDSCVITTTTTRYGVTPKMVGDPEKYTRIEFDADYLVDKNGDKAWLPLYVTVTITGDGADEMRASLLGRADNFEDANAKQKYIDICNGKTVTVYEYDEELWDLFVSGDNIIVEKNDEEMTFTQIIDEK
jgi:hypothetical protein